MAGAVYLEATTFTPLNLEPAVLAVSPHVFPQFRRQGVGSALMEAACRFAEQHGITHIATAAAAEARDANRFMARLSFAPAGHAARGDHQRRTSPAAAVAAGDARQRPASQRIDRVLAARRIRRERVSRLSRDRAAGQPGGDGTSAQVMREVQTRLPRSSVMTIS